MKNNRTRARWVAGLGSVVTLFSLMLAVEALQTVPATGLIGHWPLDSVTATVPPTTADVSPGVNTATLVNTPTITAAMFGNGLQFASANSRSLTVADSTSLNIGTNSFSVGAWVKPTGTARMVVLSKWSGTVGFHFEINAGAANANTVGHIRLRVKDAAAHDHDYAVAGAVGNGVWKHIAGVYDRTTKKATLYVNGEPKGAVRDITNLTGALTNTTELRIGTVGTTGPYYNGVMDEPVLYNRALTAAEIKALAAVPQGLTSTINQVDQVTLNWTAVPGAVGYNILRSAATGGPYTFLKNVAAPATSTVDTIAAGTYYYVIQSVFTAAGGFTSTNSTQATGTSLSPQVTALPNAGLQTNENGATTSFSIKFNRSAASDTLVVVSSSAIAESVVSTTYRGVTGSYSTTATGFQVSVPANTTPTFTVTVTGVDDLFVDGAQPVTVSVSASITGLVMPPVQVTNNDNDSPGVTISRTSGLVTTEAGGQDTFTVSLNTQPYGNISMALSSSTTAEGMPSTTTMTFTTANWNTAQQVTVTGVDDAALDFGVTYAVVTGPLATTNSKDTLAYNGMNPPDIGAVNLDDEAIPPAPEAWGDGGGGGCGLLGLEAGLALLLARLLRRRR